MDGEATPCLLCSTTVHLHPLFPCCLQTEDSSNTCARCQAPPRPIILARDVKQLPPTMIELENQDEDGNYRNRFGLCCRISALGWLQATELPTFRLLRQLRMCKGMFDLPNKLFYPDHPKME
ncbi:hypothetical protein QBC45DRAFT_428608 [Copromyces sp. CBS 386.78]|nr:hypothetical protein QBC45DRAFT_428608 [Copromyces sp. CBS 386.78]